MTTVTGSTSRTTIRQQAGTSLWSRIDRTDLARTLFVAACTAALALGLDWPSPTVPLLAVIGLVVGCWPVVVEAWHDIRQRRMSMELSMLLAIIAAGVIGEWTTSLLITTFVLAAEILEDLSMDRGRDALTALMSFLPTTVTLREGHTTRDIALDDVAPGQVLVIGAANASRSTVWWTRGGRRSTSRASPVSPCRWTLPWATRSMPARSTRSVRWRCAPSASVRTRRMDAS